MKVILRKDIPNVGKKWEVKDVSDGHARNFLLPQKLAEPATEATLRALAGEKARAEREKSEIDRRHREALEKLKSKVLRFKIKVGEKGKPRNTASAASLLPPRAAAEVGIRDKAFGSITAAKIRDALKQEGIAVEKEWIMLEEGIKTTGEHRIPLKFPHGGEGTVIVIVEAE